MHSRRTLGDQGTSFRCERGRGVCACGPVTLRLPWTSAASLAADQLVRLELRQKLQSARTQAHTRAALDLCQYAFVSCCSFKVSGSVCGKLQMYMGLFCG